MRGHRAGALALLVALPLAGCTGDSAPTETPVRFERAAAPQVALATGQGLSAPVTIGVVVSGTSPRGEGQEDLPLAAGARVAAYRLNLGADATRVTLAVADDRGTAAGSVAAVAALRQQGVAGIVYASQGLHLAGGLAAAAQADVPVLLPYETRPLPAAATTSFRTGPTGAQVTDRLASFLAARGLDTPFVLSGEGVAPELAGLGSASRRGRLFAGPSLLAEAERAATSLRTGASDAVVLSASAASQAEAVAALQEYDAGATVVLAPTALSPLFATRLAGLGRQGAATTAGQYFTAGTAVTDTSTAPAVAAFLSAVRLAAEDGGSESLLGSRPLRAVGAATADGRSHDAVVALVRAAVAASSAAPEDVLGALRVLSVGAADGLVGPALDFRADETVSDADVVVLQASRRDLSPRGELPGAPALQWFAVDPVTEQAAPPSIVPTPAAS